MVTIYLLLALLPLISQVSSNMLSKAWNRAVRQTLFEQEIEDVNTVHKIDNHLVRRLIVMPLTAAFNPNQANGMHGKVQYGDKCSLPATIGRLIFEKPYDVPWIFEIKVVKRSKEVDELNSSNDDMESSTQIMTTPINDDNTNDDLDLLPSPQPPSMLLNKAYVSPLDFRSPENYIFIPKWLMKTMGLSPNDVIDLSFVRIKLAGLVVLQPLTLEWEKLMERVTNPKLLLEHEVNKYSSLTSGSTILIEVEGVEYPLYVKDTRAEGGVSVRGVRVQDSDINVDIDREFLDEIVEVNKQNDEIIEAAAKEAAEKEAAAAAIAARKSAKETKSSKEKTKTKKNQKS